MNISDWKIILIISLPSTLIYFLLLSQMGQPPSPIYGGDIYYHFGMLNHIIEGGDWLADPIFKGEWQYYSLFPILWGLSYNLIEITGVPALTFFHYSPLLLLIGAVTSSYYLGKYFFSSKKFGLLFSLSWSFIFSTFFIIHPRPAAALILFPLFIYSFLKFEDNPKRKNKLLFGVSYGVLGITHLFGFISASLVLFSYYIIKLIRNKFKLKYIKEKANNLLLPGIVTTSLLVLLIGPLLYEYGLTQQNPVTVYSTPEPTVRYFLNTALNLIFNSGTLYVLPFTIAAIFGIWSIATKRFRYKDFISALLLALIIGSFHFLLTKPLLGWHWVYWQPAFYLVYFTSILLVFLGIKFALPKLTQKWSKKYIFSILLIVIILGGATKTFLHYRGSFSLRLNHSPLDLDYRWINYGKNQNLKDIKPVSQWIKENTQINDIFLSNNLGSFSVNAMTGRKIVTTRRTHASPYVNVNKREADAAVMLYGDNKKLTKQLLEKYKVEYLYLHPNWPNLSEYNPLLVPTKYKKYLKKNGVNFAGISTKLDPAKFYVPKYERLKVIPPKKEFKDKPIMNFFELIYQDKYGIKIYKRKK